MQTLKLFALRLLLALTFAAAFCAPAFSQTKTAKPVAVEMQADGNYHRKPKPLKTEADLSTGCQKSAAKYVDSKGGHWNVYLSPSGEVFAVIHTERTRKDGTKYDACRRVILTTDETKAANR